MIIGPVVTEEYKLESFWITNVYSNRELKKFWILINFKQYHCKPTDVWIYNDI